MLIGGRLLGLQSCYRSAAFPFQRKGRGWRGNWRDIVLQMPGCAQIRTATIWRYWSDPVRQFTGCSTRNRYRPRNDIIVTDAPHCGTGATVEASARANCDRLTAVPENRGAGWPGPRCSSSCNCFAACRPGARRRARPAAGSGRRSSAGWESVTMPQVTPHERRRGPVSGA
jgi:hypothetical protein